MSFAANTQQIHFLFQSFRNYNQRVKKISGQLFDIIWLDFPPHSEVKYKKPPFQNPTSSRWSKCWQCENMWHVAAQRWPYPHWMQQWSVFAFWATGCHLVWLTSPTRAQGSPRYSKHTSDSTIRLLTGTRGKRGEKNPTSMLAVSLMRQEQTCTQDTDVHTGKNIHNLRKHKMFKAKVVFSLFCINVKKKKSNDCWEILSIWLHFGISPEEKADLVRLREP